MLISPARPARRRFSGDVPAKLPDTRDFCSRRLVWPDCVRHQQVRASRRDFLRLRRCAGITACAGRAGRPPLTKFRRPEEVRPEPASGRLDDLAPNPAGWTTSIPMNRREPSYKGARARLDGRPDVIFAAARHQKSRAFLFAVVGSVPAAVQKTHDFQIALERDQVLSVRLANQRQRKPRGL